MVEQILSIIYLLFELIDYKMKKKFKKKIGLSSIIICRTNICFNYSPDIHSSRIKFYSNETNQQKKKIAKKKHTNLHPTVLKAQQSAALNKYPAVYLLI